MFLIAVLAVALPLRVLSMPIGACYIADMAETSAHATQHDALRASAGDDCSGTINCSAKDSSTQMSHASCTEMCGAVGAISLPTGVDEDAWTSVLAAHREPSFLSIVLALLERPPKTFSA